MTTDVAPLAGPGRPPVTRGPDGWLDRVELITPAMCGPNALFVGQLGDWTWDAVGASCGVDPYTAADPDGEPVYLSFAYFRVRSDTGLSADELTFGDRLRVRSKVLSGGGDSLLTVHRVTRDGEGAVPATGPADTDGVDGFFRYDTPGCIHVENFNRWVKRSGHDTNHGLRRATPAGFRADHLPQVPDAHTPRRIWAQARQSASLRTTAEPAPRARLSLTYRVSASRDLNGVGLLYFASYFSIVDWAVLSLWHHLGLESADFLRRRVLDRQLCYLANANADDLLDIEVTTHRDAAGAQVVDVTLRLRDGGLLAVARQRVDRGPDGTGRG
ncbi:biosynthesis cluster domain-containing protein [Streptomyces sp. JH002]|uniref:LnmK family bifunctional acyltransferase/decarboxylase n=1 Tax=Streptomyces TaxID=1883 RepID=UPI00367EA797